MSYDEQIVHFGNEVDAVVNRFSEEYDLPSAVIVGILQMKIHLLCVDAFNREEEEENPPKIAE
jgi:hypothetical protein